MEVLWTRFSKTYWLDKYLLVVGTRKEVETRPTSWNPEACSTEKTKAEQHLNLARRKVSAAADQENWCSLYDAMAKSLYTRWFRVT